MSLDTTSAAAWMTTFSEAISAAEADLTELDRQIGDGDHGANMARGMRAVAALDAGKFSDPQAYLKKVGMTLVSTVGGASGPLYGTFFLRMAGALPTDDVSAAQLGEALQAGVDGVATRGKAEVGFKTMIDALSPAVDAYRAAVDSGSAEPEALQAAAEAAEQGRDSTTPLVAKRGRASYLGERSAGHTDPGAASSALLIEALRDALS